MALSFEQQLAQVNGVVIPSPHPAGQPPSKPRKTRPTVAERDDIRTKTRPTVAERDDIRTKTCPICGHAAARSREIRSHFVTCVKTNGNPLGARWHDNFNYVPRPNQRKRKHDDIGESANTDTDNPTALTQFVHAQPTAQHQQQQRDQQQRDNRQRRYYEHLTAVNGVIIPSKLAPDAPPIRTNCDTSEGRTYACPICDGLYQTAYAVQSHFPKCVEVNGNPTGARWDDVCTHPTAEQQQQRKKPRKCQHRNQQQRDERRGRYYERLAAVNGIVIPSKLPPDAIPFQQNLAASGAHRFVCPICGGSYVKSYHVQSHFINCAEINGNPTGAQWDDACVFRNTRHINRKIDMQLQTSQTNELLQAQDYDIGDLGFDDFATEDQFPLSNHQYSALQSAVSASDDYHSHGESHSNRSPSVGLEELCESDFVFGYPDPELLATASSSSSFPSDYPGPYSSYTRMERTASEALLCMHQGQNSLAASPSSNKVGGGGGDLSMVQK